MAALIAASLFVSGATAARIATQNSLNVSMAAEQEHPIPTPDGYEFDMGQMNFCYGSPPPAGGTEGPDYVPAGYKVRRGQKCPGAWIEHWADGSGSNYGSIKYFSLRQCAQICNEHAECEGFYTKDGACSYWRSGNLQDTPGTDAPGSDCFVQWEVRDLSSDAPPAKPYVAPPPGSVKPTGGQVSDCLCVWDVDRTLTAKQGWHDRCPDTKFYPGIIDFAYDGGLLILSDIALNLKQTFCGQCYFAVVSAGTASGPGSDTRDLLDSLVDPKYNVGDWVDGCPHPVWGSKALCCGEGPEKKQAVRDIVTWLGKNGVSIADEKVHFFDDKRNNIEAFAGGPFNAHQVSCASRDSTRGGCGGVVSEVVDTPGQHFC